MTVTAAFFEVDASQLYRAWVFETSQQLKFKAPARGRSERPAPLISGVKVSETFPPVAVNIHAHTTIFRPEAGPYKPYIWGAHGAFACVTDPSWIELVLTPFAATALATGTLEIVCFVSLPPSVAIPSS